STSLFSGAWGVIANSSIDLSRYHDAELAYTRLLELTPADDESRQDIIDGLAASIYKQGEEANSAEDFALAAEHFLRIKTVAPTSEIRPVAEYDAAAALIKLEAWSQTAEVLEAFRTAFPKHELTADATKQLAHVYREDNQLEKSAIEHERIARESNDPELKRAALLTAGDLYDEVESIDNAIRIYRQYVSAYPRPLDVAMETRYRLAEIYKDTNDRASYHAELEALIRIDRQAGSERTDRSRYLAGKGALVLAEIDYEKFEEIELRQPFEQSLARKQKQMDRAMEVFESLLDYEVPEVTAAATYYIAEIYFEFSNALMNSERPTGLTDSEMLDYELVIEEEAYPFEEQAITVHEENYELLSIGIYNPWVQKSIDRLGTMMPGRYAKHEMSSGFLKSIDRYAYRMPVTDGIDGMDVDDMESNSLSEIEDLPLETAQVPGQ
ncbi:MAG: hypothetical protein HUJ31_10760, partial [Pseudomonadales bacterium]|nr:hypothetical protein [Pseudomonadales bacterium]